VSEENVEVIRSNRAASMRGDWEALAATYDPNILVRNGVRWPEPCVFGREAAIRFFQGAIEAGGSDVHHEEIVDLGDRLVVRERWNIHGQHSGVEGEQHHTAIVTSRAGRIILIEYFLDHEQALKAVGLEEGWPRSP
jgi:ketosteroid isomerase-like protein